MSIAREASNEILLPLQTNYASSGAEWINPRTGKVEIVDDLAIFQHSSVSWNRTPEGLIQLAAEARNSLLWESLVSHMDSEFGFGKEFGDWRKLCTAFVTSGYEKPSRSELYDKGQQIVEQLRIVSLRRSFQGTCDICRFW